jgi:hypothetical protein
MSFHKSWVVSDFESLKYAIIDIYTASLPQLHKQGCVVIAFESTALAGERTYADIFVEMLGPKYIQTGQAVRYFPRDLPHIELITVIDPNRMSGSERMQIINHIISKSLGEKTVIIIENAEVVDDLLPANALYVQIVKEAGGEHALRLTLQN